DALSSPAAIVLVLLVFIPRLLSFEAFVHPLRAVGGGSSAPRSASRGSSTARPARMQSFDGGRAPSGRSRGHAPRAEPVRGWHDAPARCTGARSRQPLGSRGSFAAPLRQSNR